MSKNNPRKYQYLDEILDDLCKIAKSDLSKPAKAKLYDHLCWKFTEFNGKYRGMRFWSRDAFAHYSNRKKGENWWKELRHEHIVPKNIFVDSILKNPDVDPEVLKTQFKDKMIACVVTTDEDKLLSEQKLRSSMPDGNTNFFEISDIWERYKASDIEVLELEWETNKSPKKVEKIV